MKEENICALYVKIVIQSRTSHPWNERLYEQLRKVKST